MNNQRFSPCIGGTGDATMCKDDDGEFVIEDDFNVSPIESTAITPGQRFETHEMICGLPCPVIVYHDDDGIISDVILDIGNDLIQYAPSAEWIAKTHQAIKCAKGLMRGDGKDETIEQLRHDVRLLIDDVQRLRSELDEANGVIR